MDTVTIAQRFNGPPNSGNGGYTCGLLARFIDGPAKVRLKSPPPLETPLTVVRDDPSVSLFAADAEIARAEPATLELDVPALPPPEEILRCEQRYRGHTQHGFPSCFVCGPARDAGDGLRLFAGPLDERSDQVAAPWLPDESLADADGFIDPVFVWSALDCPGAFSFEPDDGLAVVLGEMTARIDDRVRPGEPLTVLGWHLAADGRRHDTGTAVVRADGDIVAIAKARWFEVDPSAFNLTAA